MAEMICDIQQGASTDVWAGSPDSVDATPLMPQITLSQKDAGEIEGRGVSFALTGL
jgi:hypothetical protein